MTRLADAPSGSAPLVRDLLTQVSAERRRADSAEVRIIVLAVDYAHANPALPGQEPWRPASLPSWLDPGSYEGTDPEDLEWHGLPALRWDAPAAFAAANAMTTTAGKALIRDGLVLVHRAPGVWEAVKAGQLPVWRARKVAQALLGQHDDVCAYVDRALVERIATDGAVGPVVLERLLDEAMLRLHAEERELDQLEALDRRHVTIDPRSINHNGIADLEASADCVDLFNLDETLSALAEALKHLPAHQHESLDVRRSIALGILADPARAQALLQGDLDAKPTRVRELVASLHLTEPHLLHLDPVLTDADQRAHLDQVIRDWVGRHDIALTVRTIRHCGGRAGGCTTCPAQTDCDHHSPHARKTYLPAGLDRDILELATKTCAHPHCTRPARHCDCDHIKPFDSGGATCPNCNLAPLCRHHHRLKTHAAWRYWKLDPTTYLWQDPHGLLYLRVRDGTRQLD
ncbi:HNH endonuclease signature motif containing protein [Nocardioides dilutus]